MGDSLSVVAASVRGVDETGDELLAGEPREGDACSAELPSGAVPDVGACLDQALAWIARVAQARTATLTPDEHRRAVQDGYALIAAAQAAGLHLLRTLDERPEAVPGAHPDRVGQYLLTHVVRLSPAQAASDVAAAWALDPDGAGFVIGADAVDRAAAVDPGLGVRTVAGTPVGPLPMLGQALANGQVTRGHVDVAVRTLRHVPRGALTARSLLSGADGDKDARAVGAVDAFLFRQSVDRGPRAVDRLAADLLEALAVNPREQSLRDQHERRHLTLSTDRAGMVHVRAQLDPVSGRLFKTVLETFMTSPGGSTAPAAQDGEPVPFPDRRTAGQRRADALAAWIHATVHGTGFGGCTCGGEDASAATALRPTARVTVVATPAQLAAAVAVHPIALDADGNVLGPPASAPPSTPTASLVAIGEPPGSTFPRAAAGCAVDEWGDPLTHGVLARLLCGAELQAVTISQTRRVLDLGRTVRVATPRQRAVLVARDRGCVVPDCTAPLSRCEAHHVVWWRHGGTTDVENLALVCTRHHTEIHSGVWTLLMRDGVPWAVPPRWMDPTGTPRRNTLPDAESEARRLGRQLRRHAGD